MAILLAAGPDLVGAPRRNAPEPREVVLRGTDEAGGVLALRVPGNIFAQLQQAGASPSVNISQVGGASVAGTLYDSANTALKVNCVVGCSATGSFTDNGAFTTGATSVTNISGLFNDAATNLTSGNAGAIRATTDRMLFVNVGKLGGTALTGMNPGDAANNAFRVNCVIGCAAGAGFADNSAFTAGTTAVTNVGGVFNDALAAVTSGNAAAPRITSSRAFHVNLRNNAGAEIGTATTPVRTDPTGATTQPVSGTVTANAGAGTFTVSGAVTANQGTAAALSAAWPARITDGTNSAAVKAASTTPTAADPAMVVGLSPNSLGCAGQPIASLLKVNINQTAGSQIITGVAAQRVYICGMFIVSATAQNLNIVEGTGAVCATGTAGMTGGTTAATGPNLLANQGWVMGNGVGVVTFSSTAANNVCLLQSGTGQVSGVIVYAQF